LDAQQKNITLFRASPSQNIHAHYDISNDLFRIFLDKETMMYSSAIYDAMAAPPLQVGRPSSGLVFKGSLEEAQWRKLDTLCDRAQLQPGQTLLDIGFGWGGLSIHAAKVSYLVMKKFIWESLTKDFVFCFKEIWMPCHRYHSQRRAKGVS
jgi:cyclopropane fatty-acyl-phospholipid synthase-like methyltransferase